MEKTYPKNLPIEPERKSNLGTKKPRSRFVRDRGRPPRIYITERDLRVLSAVASYRFLTTQQVDKLYFGSISQTRHRLFLLWQNRLLERLFQPVVAFEGTSSAIYALARPGAMLLAERMGADPATLKPLTHGQARRSAYFLDHTLRRNDFRICLELACRGGEDMRLLYWRQNAEEVKDAVWVDSGPGRGERVPLVPDGFFGLSAGGKKLYFLVEIDRGTETIKHVGRKLKGYYSWWQGGGSVRRFGIPNVRVLVVTTGRTRHDNILRAALAVRDDYRGTGLIWLATDESVTLDDPGRVLDRIWRKATSSDRISHSLVE